VRAADLGPVKKRHMVTLSFDDGFKKSFIRTAEQGSIRGRARDR
jgi:hypothetical protein